MSSQGGNEIQRCLRGQWKQLTTALSPSERGRLQVYALLKFAKVLSFFTCILTATTEVGTLTSCKTEAQGKQAQRPLAWALNSGSLSPGSGPLAAQTMTTSKKQNSPGWCGSVD